ncbi:MULTISPECIES: DUF4123 domain-containing protein [Achromobacter]|uniref:DUF4123 domain-containing protein n=1 Tax=Achromobacter TaxID=222 RepID=UPI0006C2E80D|nr:MULTISPECIES: DUF4123 domain-containing protein [Achromobacter]MCG2604221.1 DUF4123 domain-containing protein [Achromobacter sp.]CAB3922156.1 hypothetical protein LMG26846_05688 [Achromobacter insuavis]CUJ57014.1 Uncharacterised protein [Achromobacter sp. 2789STDY5608621]CUK06149.1 Uncharacterised protein [Achromobacter sp. 2789STDY5608615]
MFDGILPHGEDRDAAVRLYERLLAAAARTPSSALYVLVDPTIEDPLAHAARRESAVALPLDRGRFLAGHCPYLLALGDFGRDDAIELSIAAACAAAAPGHTHRAVCGWIASPVAPTALARHLARMARCLVPDRADPVTLRHWDPRVAEVLAEVLSEDQLRQWLAPVQAYWRPCRAAGELAVQYERPAAAGAPQAGPAAPLVLDRAQCAVLERAGWVNQALDALAEAGHDMAEARLRERADRQVARAQARWGLETDTDIVDFALHGLLVHPHFDQHPDVRHAMATVQASGVAAVAALNDITEEQWNRVRQWPGTTVEPEQTEVRDGGAF